jgi:hypothetical protein
MYKMLSARDNDNLTSFFVTLCVNKNATCKTGDPYPTDAWRFEDSGEEPCKWYIEGKGCVHPKHPRHKKGWKT